MKWLRPSHWGRGGLETDGGRSHIPQGKNRGSVLPGREKIVLWNESFRIERMNHASFRLVRRLGRISSAVIGGFQLTLRQVERTHREADFKVTE